MEIRGLGPAQERRQVALAISEMVSRVFAVSEGCSWVVHKGGDYNRERDERRGIRLERAPEVESPAGRLGFEIRLARLELGWSQEYLASRAEINRGQLSLIERGKVRVSERTLRRLKQALAENVQKPTTD